MSLSRSLASRLPDLPRWVETPVWGAMEEIPASRRLARRLGFVPVDELVLFEPCGRAHPPSP